MQAQSIDLYEQNIVLFLYTPLFEPALIAEKFADIFKAACAPNSAERHASLKDHLTVTLKSIIILLQI